ncbi:LysR substrate-binding domain-containing protein [Aeromicrobium choanae]|uniref:DNA-binding transcriptional regulator, LysR family n=1 Tax=Aeromicrobium choanae TaxID=1736691 RepID=A0A1T4Z4N6_9ACTN|nr:LysR substrate-binding domain-containing protein [Aeromicrobium choanae]SKB08969.1 DNA-binding transcriptional regulator, LysR family [Aeromicrobium choanae]
MTPDVDMETLRLLVDLAELNSLSAAAQARGISQPAASARLRSFEARWRVTVADRSPRGTALTTDGLAIVSWARTVLHEVDLMRAALTALSDERHAELEVAASLTIAEFILPRWLGELRSRSVVVRPRLHVVNSEKVAELVRSRTVDVGFIESAAVPRDLAHRLVGSDQLAVVVDPRHPWARRSTPVPHEALRNEAWVLRETGSGTRSTFERALRFEPHLAMEADSTTALIGAARAGVGPAVVSRRAVASELETGRLVEVTTDLDLWRPLTAIWLMERRLPDSVDALLRIARAGTTRRPST